MTSRQALSLMTCKVFKLIKLREARQQRKVIPRNIHVTSTEIHVLKSSEELLTVSYADVCMSLCVQSLASRTLRN